MRKWLIVSSVVLGIVAAVACKKSDEGTPSGVSCKPGSRTICLCPNKDKGTWVCNPGGNGYGPCELAEGVSCPGTSPDGDAGDPCAGTNVSLTETEQSFTDDTSGGDAIFKGLDACSNTNDGKEKVYILTSAKDGKATVRVEPGSGFDASVYVRSDTCGKGSQVACSETGGAGKTESVTFNVTAGTAYTVVVDGTANSSGTYKVAFSLGTGACGNNTVDKGETCDDGNTSDGDGCNATCTKADGDPAPSVGNDCPGQPVHVWDNATSATGTFASYANNQESTGCPLIGGVPPGQTQPEHLYAVTAHKSGMLTVAATTTDATFDFALYARSNCSNAASELKCSDIGDQGEGETINFPVTDGQTYTVIIDGVNSGTQVPYTLTFAIQ